MRIEFIVPGPLMGYKQTTKNTMFHPNERARSKAYGQFKKNVLLLSMEAGAPNMGMALKEMAPKFSVEVFWKEEPRIDWKNLYGALEDAIWYEDDRYVIPGKLSNVHWNTGREEAKVVIELKKTGSGVRGET
jgi:sugar phosphate isomerase/epimerase